MSEDTGVRRAWGWIAHLLDGGTTPWAAWAGEAEPRGRVLPGAQQLELLRRLNAERRPSRELAERVLGASAPGRGRADLELVGAAPIRRFGPPPVDPAHLPEDELIRVAVGLLAEDVVAAGLPDPPRPGWPRFWRPRYRLVGDPALADPLRAALTAQGRPPGGRRPTVLVLGASLDRMLTDAWTTRCFTEGAEPWRDWLEPRVRRDRLPVRADLWGTAHRWESRVGRDRVAVVLDPALLPGLVGVRRLPVPSPPAADAVELGRRVGQVLGLLAVPDRRQALLEQTLRPRLEECPGPPLVVPERHREWVHRHAARLRDALLRAGYAVHGNPDSLLPGDPEGVPEPSDAGVLAHAVRLLHERRG
jgi:hypothetical protein